MSRDLNIVQGLVYPGSARVSFGLAGENGGQTVGGPQKAIQRFVTLLLTASGSSYFDPDRGTAFMPALRNGAIRTDEDLAAYFGLAVSDVLAYLRDRTLDDPADEVITSVRPRSVAVSNGGAVIVADVVFLAGNRVVVTLPVPGGGS